MILIAVIVGILWGLRVKRKTSVENKTAGVLASRYKHPVPYEYVRVRDNEQVDPLVAGLIGYEIGQALSHNDGSCHPDTFQGGGGESGGGGASGGWSEPERDTSSYSDSSSSSSSDYSSSDSSSSDSSSSSSSSD